MNTVTLSILSTPPGSDLVYTKAICYLSQWGEPTIYWVLTYTHKWEDFDVLCLDNTVDLCNVLGNYTAITKKSVFAVKLDLTEQLKDIVEDTFFGYNMYYREGWLTFQKK